MGCPTIRCSKARHNPPYPAETLLRASLATTGCPAHVSGDSKLSIPGRKVEKRRGRQGR